MILIDSPQIEYQTELEAFFHEVTPRLLELIKNKGITHILLLEKSARVFKYPLIQLVQQQELNVKVGSIAPDYFPKGFLGSATRFILEKIFYQKHDSDLPKSQITKKLKFLENFDNTSQVLILDEFTNTGSSLDSANAGLISMGIPPENIHSIGLDGRSQSSHKALKPDGSLNKIMHNNENSAFDKLQYFKSDDSANGVYHPKLKSPQKYRAVVQRLTRIVLETSDNQSQ